MWQLKAEQVVHDKELQIVEYRDTTMEIDGVPVLWTPYFSHPDPSVKRASGFLVPDVGFGNILGFHTTIPYYWVLGPDKDLTLRPIITTSAGVVLDGEYRQRFGNGTMTNEASIEAGSGRQTASAGNIGPPTGSVRWHLFGTGEWDLTSAWRTGYQVQRESDQTYMLRYHFLAPPNYLTTHLYAENFGANSYGNISGFGFQSLNPLYGDSAEPLVLPTAFYDWTGDPDSIGGRLHLTASALNLARHTGPEERRISGGSGWRLPFNGLIGDRFEFSANLRTDAYYSNHVPLTPNFVTVTNEAGTVAQLPSNVGTSTEWAARLFPVAALKWRYPWVRTDASGGSELIEPIAAVIASPHGGNPSTIPNIDSQGFEFDEQSLFVANRLPGYDRVDTGQRADYGVHTLLRTTSWGSWETLVGQSYRLQRDTQFLPGSGLDERLSDIVGRVVATPNSYLDFIYRFRLDKNDFAARRQEASVRVGPQSLHASLSYISIASIPGTSPVPAGDQVGATLDVQLTRYWSVSLHDVRSFGSGGATIVSGVSATYRDDCFAVVTSIEQSGIRVGDVRPGVSVLLTFVFKNLGEVGERVFSSGT